MIASFLLVIGGWFVEGFNVTAINCAAAYYMCPQVLKLLGYLLSSKQHPQLTILETPAHLANKTESLGPVCEN
jgi:hypothetical protein